MARQRYDCIIVGGGSAGSVLANCLTEDPGTTPVLVLKPGQFGLADRSVHPYAGRPDIPDRQPLLRLDVRVRARAVHARPSRLSRPRQGAGRFLSSINGQIFQRGNPLDFERWGGRPGHGGLELRALPAVLQADGDLPLPQATQTIRGAATTGRWCWSADRRRVRCSRPSSRRQSRRATRARTTSTAIARRVRAVRPEHPQGPPLVRRSRLHIHPIMGKRRNLTVRTSTLRHPRACCTARRATGVEIERQGGGRGDHRCRRGDPRGWVDQLAAVPDAVGRGPGRRPRARSGSR